MSKKDKSWLILPLLIFSKYGNGSFEIAIGWLTNTYYIKWGGKHE